jgi:hypothetical protein
MLAKGEECTVARHLSVSLSRLAEPVSLVGSFSGLVSGVDEDVEMAGETTFEGPPPHTSSSGVMRAANNDVKSHVSHPM